MYSWLYAYDWLHAAYIIYKFKPLTFSIMANSLLM